MSSVFGELQSAEKGSKSGGNVKIPEAATYFQCFYQNLAYSVACK